MFPHHCLEQRQRGLFSHCCRKNNLRQHTKLQKLKEKKQLSGFVNRSLNAVGEVSDALVKIEKLKTEKSIAVNRVNTLQKAISNANMLFSNGMANYLEVITAQSNVLQSELELTAITREQVSAKIELYKSLGGGWN